MTETQIRFDDGAAYERMMGAWSRLAGEQFLDWLKPPPGGRWIDVGCGNGAFTELLAERCKPSSIQGIDPSEGQLTFARSRHSAGVATFRQGDAMALPFPDRSFDAAVMALVLFFVPDPTKGVAEMMRVVRSGGLVSAYLWDFGTGGFPLEPLQAALRQEGITPPLPPSVGISKAEAMHELWIRSRLQDVSLTRITVRRTFGSFDDFWSTSMLAASLQALLAKLTASELQKLKDKMRERLSPDEGGRVAYDAWANAIKGRVA